MNKIAVQTGGTEKLYGTAEAYGRIKDWGFDAVDANIDHVLSGGNITKNDIPELLIKGGRECMELFKPWRDGAKTYGVDNFQAHAPFPSWVAGEAEINGKMIEVLKNTIRACDYIDCRRLIIHPFFAGYDKMLSFEDEWALNLESYAKLIPVAKENGVTICLENMFTAFKGKIIAACCSNPVLACKYVDELNALAGENVFGFCLDTGHALLCGLDIRQTMLTLGKRICAFHIHDNNGTSDQHLAPYMGVLDWQRFIEGLRLIGYKDTLSFETFNVWNVVDNEVIDHMMRFIYDCGVMFSRRAELQ